MLPREEKRGGGGRQQNGEMLKIEKKRGWENVKE